MSNAINGMDKKELISKIQERIRQEVIWEGIEEWITCELWESLDLPPLVI